MDDILSRRALGRRAIAAAAAASLPRALAAQDEKPATPPIVEAESKEIEALLAKPLSERAGALLRAAVASNKNSAKERLKTRLPENSEPCFTYVPTPAGNRRR